MPQQAVLHQKLAALPALIRGPFHVENSRNTISASLCHTRLDRLQPTHHAAPFRYGQCLPDFGAAASIIATKSARFHSLSVTAAAMAGLTRNVWWMRAKH
jgi:hypothetical protein